MKLAFCLYKYFPYGGLQRDFLQIANKCQKRGCEIIVYTMSWQGEIPQNMTIILVPKKGFSNNTRNTNYYHWVKKHLCDHPVDKVIGFNKMPELDIYYAADSCFAKKAFTEKNFLYRLTNRCRHYLVFEKAVFSNRHTKILVLTNTQVSDFIKYYHTPNNQIFMLPPGIATDRKYNTTSSIKRLEFRKQHQITDDTIVITQIGSDFKRKGVDRSLIAIANLPDVIKQKVIYLIVGQDNATSYQQLAQKLGIAKQVKFFSGRDNIPDFLFASDMLIHPARQEAAGIVLIEALAAGLPVIVTEVSGYAFHINQAQAGRLIPEPFQQQNLNDVLLSVLSDKKQLKLWQNNAINYADTTDLYNLAGKAADIILEENQ